MHLKRKPRDRRVAQEILVKTVEIGVELCRRDRGIRFLLLVDAVLDVHHGVDAPRPAWGCRTLGHEGRRQHEKTQSESVPCRIAHRPLLPKPLLRFYPVSRHRKMRTATGASQKHSGNSAGAGFWRPGRPMPGTLGAPGFGDGQANAGDSGGRFSRLGRADPGDRGAPSRRQGPANDQGRWGRQVLGRPGPEITPYRLAPDFPPRPCSKPMGVLT